MKRGRIAVRVGAALVLLAAAGLGASFGAERWIRHRLDAELAAAPFTKASHGAVRYSLRQGALDIDDLMVETALPEPSAAQAAHLRIEGLGLRWLLGAGAGEIGAERAAAERLELVRGDRRTSIDALAVTGLHLDGGATVGPDAAMAMLSHLSAAELTLRNLRSRAERSEQDVTLNSVVAERVEGGRIAVVTVKGLASITGARTAAPERVDIAELRLDGVGLVAWYRAAGEADAENETPAPLVDTLGASGIGIAQGETQVAAQALTLAGLRAAPGALQRPVALAGALGAPIELDRFDTSGVELTLPGDGGKASLGRLSLRRLKTGSLGEIRIEGLAAASPRAMIRLAGAEAEDLAYGAGTAGPSPQVFFGRLHLADLAAGAKPGSEIAVKDLLATMEGGLGNPRALAVKVAAVTVPATAVPQLLAAGYNELSFDYDAQSHYDTSAGVIDSTQRLAARDAGDLSLSLRLGGYRSATAAEDATMAINRLLEARLERFELRYDDASLVERLIKLNAAATHRDSETVRRAAIAQLEAQRQAFAGKPALAASIDSAIAFLRQPGSISLVLAPPQPLALVELMMLARSQPADIFDRLGFSMR